MEATKNWFRSCLGRYISYIQRAKATDGSRILSLLIGGVLSLGLSLAGAEAVIHDLDTEHKNSTQKFLFDQNRKVIEKGYLKAEYCASKDTVSRKAKVCADAEIALVDYYNNSSVKEDSLVIGTDYDYLLLLYKKALYEVRTATLTPEMSIFSMFPFNMVSVNYFELVTKTGVASWKVWIILLFPLIFFVHVYFLYVRKSPEPTPDDSSGSGLNGTDNAEPDNHGDCTNNLSEDELSPTR
ncbi:hypothetical protein [Vibrio superstes]|uniref:Uncharacterized protein n=1 Tax=Vibrio superstes NBRC 103154 TaxID=1219062 RepID=A0A511QP31_9VIBR|nr:hypothetical protein [Vibrio superstes]GEM78897.1 hypothetical protein VSU01S_11420 [Vibrio superstes NBRC 103154]